MNEKLLNFASVFFKLAQSNESTEQISPETQMVHARFSRLDNMYRTLNQFSNMQNDARMIAFETVKALMGALVATQKQHLPSDIKVQPITENPIDYVTRKFQIKDRLGNPSKSTTAEWALFGAKNGGISGSEIDNLRKEIEMYLT